MSRLSSTYSRYSQPKGVKVVLVGPSGVGKTSISNRFVRDQFSGRQAATMGAAFSQKTFQYEHQKYLRMQLWDTAGQQKYRSIAKIYFQDAKIAILVFDVTNKSTFESMQSWAEEVRNSAPKDIILAVVGNKVDLLGDIMSQIEENQYQNAKMYALGMRAIFKVVSAKSSKGIKELFTQIAYKVVDQLQNESHKKMTLSTLESETSRRRCCH